MGKCHCEQMGRMVVHNNPVFRINLKPCDMAHKMGRQLAYRHCGYPLFQPAVQTENGDDAACLQAERVTDPCCLRCRNTGWIAQCQRTGIHFDCAIDKCSFLQFEWHNAGGKGFPLLFALYNGWCLNAEPPPALTFMQAGRGTF